MCSGVCVGGSQEEKTCGPCCQTMLYVPPPPLAWLRERHMANEPVWRWIRRLIISDRKALRCI